MSDFTLDELKLAFTYDMVRSVIQADGTTGFEEAEYLGALCPRIALKAADFLDDMDATTDRFTLALEASFERLPRELSLEEKLALVNACFEASLADGCMDDREESVFRLSARLLGVTEDEFDAYLEQHPSVGVIGMDDLVSEEEPEAAAVVAKAEEAAVANAPVAGGDTIVPGKITASDLDEE